MAIGSAGGSRTATLRVIKPRSFASIASSEVQNQPSRTIPFSLLGLEQEMASKCQILWPVREGFQQEITKNEKTAEKSHL